MRKIFFRYLFPLLSISIVALTACYYFLNFITTNNLEIAKDKFKIYNKEKQREVLIRSQVNEIKISQAALKVKWENLKQSINALNLLDYRTNEFGRTVRELIVIRQQLTQIYIVDNSGKNPYMVYGGLERKGVNFRNHKLIKKKIYNKLDYEDEIIEIKGKTFILLCMPYYTGKLLTIFSLDNFTDELNTVNSDNQYVFLLDGDNIIKHSDLKEMNKTEAQEMIKPYLDSLRLNNRGNQLNQHLAVINRIFDNNDLLLFSTNAVENDKSFKESVKIFDAIFNDNKKENYKDLIYWLAGISMLTLLLGIYFAYTNSRPIIELKKKIKSVIDGDFNARVKYTANNELDDVANSFNSMINLIQNNREDLINEKNKVIDHKIELEKSNKLLENFAYLVSHDLKQPLRNINSFANLLSKSNNLSEKEKKFLKFINDGCDSMGKIINGFLEFSLLSTNPNTELVHIDLNNTLQTALLNNEVLIKEKNSEIVYSELPVIYGDSAQLTSLFQNLISNAAKFSEENPCIKISSDTIDGYHNIQFKDNGIGIPQENLADIFELFKQAPGSNGNGIGLALCKKIVDVHNGKISVSSKLNEGSIFTVSLPVNIPPVKKDSWEMKLTEA